MDALQNSTDANLTAPVVAQNTPYAMLTDVQRAYVDYKALGGLITNDDGIRKMKVDELASMLGVTRDAMYKAKAQVPNFWALVTQRRNELSGEERLAAMSDIWYLRAKGTGTDAFKYFQLWQANFNPNFRMPTEKKQIDIGDNLSTLFGKMRGAKGIVEGEVVDEDAEY
jgi:hypothetical protein